jgi:hypothetical protein
MPRTNRKDRLKSKVDGDLMYYIMYFIYKKVNKNYETVWCGGAGGKIIL